MFNEGDSVVFINDDRSYTVGGESSIELLCLELHKIYIVTGYIYGVVLLEGLPYRMYDENRFILLSDMRKEKIDKLMDEVHNT